MCLRRNVVNPGSVTPAAAAARRTLLSGNTARSDARASPRDARKGSGTLSERRGSAKIGAVPGREDARRGSNGAASALDGAIAVELVTGAKRPTYPNSSAPSEGKDGVVSGDGSDPSGPTSPSGESDAASAPAPQGFRVRNNPLSGSGPKTPASAFAAAAEAPDLAKDSDGGDGSKGAGGRAAGKDEDAGLGQGLAWDGDDEDTDAADVAHLLAPQVRKSVLHFKAGFCQCAFLGATLMQQATHLHRVHMHLHDLTASGMQALFGELTLLLTVARMALLGAQDLVEQTFKNLFPDSFVAAHPVQRHKVSLSSFAPSAPYFLQSFLPWHAGLHQGL